MNLETITDALSWYKIGQLSGFNHTRAKQELLRKQKRAYKSSWSRRGNQQLFTLTIPKNLGKPVKTCLGIIVRQHHTDQKQMGLLREQCVELRKGHLRYCCKPGLDENWWADSMECYSYLRNIQDLLSDGKTPFERRFGKPFKGPITPFGSLVEYYPFLRKTSQESINLERKSYLDCSLDTLCTRGEFGRVTIWLQTLRSWKRWTHLKSTQKDSVQRK